MVFGINYKINVYFQQTRCVKSSLFKISSFKLPSLFAQNCPIKSNSAKIPAQFVIYKGLNSALPKLLKIN